jgi:hypothetical protein
VKKQSSDQQFHDRRHQERKRAEAAKKLLPNKITPAEAPAEAAVPAPARKKS